MEGVQGEGREVQGEVEEGTREGEEVHPDKSDI